jgi:LSD1 subclass zinc finger protein
MDIELRLLAELNRRIEAIKTIEQYTRQMRQYARDYYTGKIDDGGFLDKMIAAVGEQFKRAWYEGMRENGLDPTRDMTEEWQARLDLLVEQEQGFITNLADLINGQREKQAGMDAIYNRVDVWASNYGAIRQAAIVETKRQMLVWHLGATEVHCSSCSALNSLVKPAKEWEARGYYPRVNGAEYLECHGFNCDCELVPTDEKESERDFPALP